MDEVKPKIRYNKTLLNHIINRDSITLIGEYDILTCQSDIKFICLCSKEAQKKLKSMYEIGSKCKECTNKSKGEKITYKLQKSKDDQTTRNNELIIQLKKIFIKCDYDYSKIMWDGKMRNSKVIMKCNKHNYEWNANVQNMIRLSSRCTKCGSESASSKTRKDFIGESKEKFGEERFDYSKVKYSAARKEIIIICKKHNEEFTCIADEHLRGKSGGCTSCSKENRSGENHCFAISLDDLKSRIKKIWGDRFEYDFTGFTCLESKIKITCSKHNRTWESTCNNHTHPTCPRGCIVCGREETGNKLRLTHNECIEKFKDIHKDLYSYDKVIYKNNGTNIIVTCKIHGDFKTLPTVHWKGYGCPICSKAGVSKGQLEWLKNIEEITGNDIIYKGGKHNYEHMFKFDNKRYKVDGYCIETKTIYEFLGCWYHGCPNCEDENLVHCWKKKTMKVLLQEFIDRKIAFEKNGYTMISIWECEWIKQKKNKNIISDAESEKLEEDLIIKL